MESQQYHPHKYVGIHDSRWIIEVVKFDTNPAFHAPGFPRWFIELLTNTSPLGHSIAFHMPTQAWWLRCPSSPDFVLEDGETHVCRNMHGDIFALNTQFERDYRRFVMGVDE